MQRLPTNLWLLIIGVIALILTALIATRDVPRTITDAREGASVVFESPTQRVLLPGECVTLSWQAEGIRRIFLNGNGVVGNQTFDFCQTGSVMPTLEIEFQTGEEVDYVLPVYTLITSPLTASLLLLGVVLILTAIYRALSNLIGTNLLDTKVGQGIRAALIPTLIGCGVAFIMLEIGLRVYFDNFGTDEQRIMYRYSVEEIRDLQQNIIHMPYVSYVPDPDFEGHNALGFRGDDIALPKPDNTFRIVAMGGSTTYSTGTAADESYPALLQSILRDEYGYTNVEVVNGGVMGYTSWEQLTNFAFRILELEPDMILLYLAVNDLVVREQSQIDCYNGQNPLRGINPHRGLFVERQAAYPASTAYRTVAITLGWIANPLNLDSSFEQVQVECTTDTPDTTLDQRLDANSTRYFRRNLFNIIVLARAHEVVPVLSSWAYYVDGERPDLWREGIAQHNAVVTDLANEMDAPYYDLAENFPVNGAFWERDGIHMVAAGTREQAQQYAAFLHESGLLPEPE